MDVKDVYINTTTHVPEEATEFDLELFERFMSGGPWDAHSEYMKLMIENARLREELTKARDPQRIGGQADQSSFVYAIEQLREFRWQHATNDGDAIPYINNVAAAHERENAKLRELVRDYESLTATLCNERECDGCPFGSKEHAVCEHMRLVARLGELEIEVDG